MIGIKLIDGMACPVVECDVCHEVIDKVEEGLAVWSHTHDCTPDKLYHCHRGRCDNYLRCVHKDYGTGWIALDQHFALVAHNLKLTPKKLNAAKKKHELFNGLGV